MGKRIASVAVNFDYPVTIKGNEVEQIELRKPKVKDMQRAAEISDNPSKQEIWLVSALSGATLSDIEDLDLDQYQLVQETMGKFKRSPMKSA